MTGLQLRLEHGDGTEKVTVPANRAAKAEELHGSIDHGSVELLAEDWRQIDAELDRRDDMLVVIDEDGSYFFAGRYDDDERDATDGSVAVDIAGRERDAVDARPTGPNLLYENMADGAIVSDLLDRTRELRTGTIESVSAGLSMSFNHAEKSKALRDVTEATGAELRFNFDGEVDYVARRGADRSDEVVISPDERTVIGDPSVTRDAREEVTHIRGLGAQSGPDQISVEVESSAYDGGKEIWKEYENKDVVDESRLRSIVERRLEEYQAEPRHIEVKADVIGVDVELGDRVAVSIPRADVDRDLRVIQRDEELTDSGRVVSLVLSNRVLTNDSSGQSSRKTLQQFNRGFQGFVDRSQVTSGWNPAGDSEPQTLEIWNWPDDVVDEKTVELAVQGRAWRSPIKPQAHGHDVEVELPGHYHDVEIDVPGHMHDVEIDVPGHQHDVEVNTSNHGHPVNLVTTSEDNADFTNIVSASQGSTTVQIPESGYADGGSVTIDDGQQVSVAIFVARIIDIYDDVGSIYVRLYNETQDEYYGSFSTGANINNYAVAFPIMVAKDIQGDTITFQYRGSQLSSGDIITGSSVQAAGAHNHTLEISDSTDADGGESILETTKDGGSTLLSETTKSGGSTLLSETTESGGGTFVTEATETSIGSTPAIITEFDGSTYYPSDVTIEVNGSTVTTVAGDSTGSWSETVDLSGHLQAGANTIKATPATRGEVNLSLASELFRRGQSVENSE